MSTTPDATTNQPTGLGAVRHLAQVTEWLAGDDLDEAAAQWAAGRPAVLRAGWTWSALVLDLPSGRDLLNGNTDWPAWLDMVAGTATVLVPPDVHSRWDVTWGASRTGAVLAAPDAEVLVPSPTSSLWRTPPSGEVADIDEIGRFLTFDCSGRHRRVSAWHLRMLEADLSRQCPDLESRIHIDDGDSDGAEVTLWSHRGQGPIDPVVEAGVRLNANRWWFVWWPNMTALEQPATPLQNRLRVAAELALALGDKRR